jgi:hypothetical protein
MGMSVAQRYGRHNCEWLCETGIFQLSLASIGIAPAPHTFLKVIRLI